MRKLMIILLLTAAMAAACLTAACGRPEGQPDNGSTEAQTAEDTVKDTDKQPAEPVQTEAQRTWEDQLAEYISRTYLFGEDKERFLRNGEVYLGEGEIDEITDVLTGEPAYYAVSDRIRVMDTDEPHPGSAGDAPERVRYALFSADGERLTDFGESRYHLAVGDKVVKSFPGEDYSCGLYDVVSGECITEDVFGVFRLGDHLIAYSGRPVQDGGNEILGLLDPETGELTPLIFGQAHGDTLGYQRTPGDGDEYMICCPADAEGSATARYLVDAELRTVASFPKDARLALPGDDHSSYGDILTVYSGTYGGGTYKCSYYSLPGMQLLRTYDQYKEGIPQYFDGQRAVISAGDGMYLQDTGGGNLAGPMKYIYAGHDAGETFFYGFDAVTRILYAMDYDGEITAQAEYPSVTAIFPCGGYLQLTGWVDDKEVTGPFLDRELQPLLPDSGYDVRPLWTGWRPDPSGGLFLGTKDEEQDSDGPAYTLLDSNGQVLIDGIRDITAEEDVLLITTDTEYGIADMKGMWIGRCAE